MKTLILFLLVSTSVIAQEYIIQDGANSIEILPNKISTKVIGIHPTNTKVGTNALSQNPVQRDNTAIGALTLNQLKIGFGNTAVGSSAILGADSSSYNTAIGAHSLENLEKANHNSALGAYTLTRNTNGTGNTAFGYYALGRNISGNKNVGIGDETLYYNENSSNNIAIGSGVMYQHHTGDANIGIGQEALIQHRTGDRNIAIGEKSMHNSISGSANIAIGKSSLENSNTDANIAIGIGSQQNNATGSENVSLGHTSLYGNVGGWRNTVVGAASAFNVKSNYNTSIGYQSLLNHMDTDKGSNTAIGSGAIFNLNSGEYNVALGRDALYFTSTGDRNVAIGSDIKGEENMSYRLIIENSGAPLDSEKPLIGGSFLKGNEAEVNNRRVGIDRHFTELMARDERFQVEGEAFKTLGSGNWVIPSDRRLKKEIANLNSVEMLNKITSLQGVSYKWMDEGKPQNQQIGFIAQDLQIVFPEKVKEDKNGYLSASYGDFDPMLVEAIKALAQQNQELRERIEKLEQILTKTAPEVLSAQN